MRKTTRAIGKRIVRQGKKGREQGCRTIKIVVHKEIEKKMVEGLGVRILTRWTWDLRVFGGKGEMVGGKVGGNNKTSRSGPQ